MMRKYPKISKTCKRRMILRIHPFPTPPPRNAYDKPVVTDEIFEMFAVEDPAEFPGGEAKLRKFLADNIEYPEAANAAESARSSGRSLCSGQDPVKWINCEILTLLPKALD